MRIWLKSVGALLLLLALQPGQVSLAAPEADGWSPPRRIPGYENEASPPHMVADQNRTVHAFHSKWYDDKLAVVYSQWTVDYGWTTPVDILFSPSKNQARVAGAYLDRAGIIHLIFFGGDDLGADFYYSWAPAVNAGRASAWSKPEVIAPGAITPATAAVVGDENGNLVVVYSSSREGIGLYATYSKDGGDSWSEPHLFFLTYSVVLWPSALELYFDNTGQLHAVWTVVNSSGNGEAIYYSRLDADFEKWSYPLQLAVAQTYEADTASLIEYESELFVIYHNDFPTTRWMRRSSDGGKTWTDPIRLFSHAGSNGAASMVIDSSNVLHMFFGNRVGTPTVHGMWHSIWKGHEWSEPEAIVSGPRVADVTGGDGFDPSYAKAVISQGNVLLLTWGTDPGAGRNGAWYAYTTLDTPALPLVALPQPTATPAPVVSIVSVEGEFTLAESTQPVDRSTINLTPPQSTSNPAIPLTVSVLPAIFLIVVIIAYKKLQTIRK